MNDVKNHLPHERLATLETKLAYLEHTVDVLSGELAAQQQETRSLLQQMDQLREQLQSLQVEGGSGDGHDEVPPHY